MNNHPPGTQVGFDLNNMFLDAMCDYEGAEILARSARGGGPWVIQPAVILYALSLEIFFKLLILKSGNKYRDSHGLYELFFLIDPGIQAKIRAYADPMLVAESIRMTKMYADLGVTDVLKPSNFDDVLELSSRAFVRTRYLYEWRKMKDQEGWHAGPILAATLRVLFEIEPLWQNWKGAPPFKPATPDDFKVTAPQGIPPTSRAP